MFHHETDASKVALMALVTRMRERGLTLLDIQWVTRLCHSGPRRPRPVAERA
jgi:Leu/Phe-tRNA-protein transferase